MRDTCEVDPVLCFNSSRRHILQASVLIRDEPWYKTYITFYYYPILPMPHFTALSQNQVSCFVSCPKMSFRLQSFAGAQISWRREGRGGRAGWGPRPCVCTIKPSGATPGGSCLHASFSSSFFRFSQSVAFSDSCTFRLQVPAWMTAGSTLEI